MWFCYINFSWLALLGLWLAFPPLQRPIHRSSEPLLDFLVPSHRFDVQFSALTLSFWTSSCLPTASTSNSRLWLTLFGLLRAFPPLQRPILGSGSLFLDFLVSSRRFNVQSAALYSLLLDFLRASRRFDVQSAVLTNPFWTLACLPTASTSNSRLWLTLFGLLRAFPPL